MQAHNGVTEFVLLRSRYKDTGHTGPVSSQKTTAIGGAGERNREDEFKWEVATSHEDQEQLTRDRLSQVVFAKESQ